MSPSIIERVTHRPPRPPASFEPIDVRARWDAMKVAFRLMHNRDRRACR